MDILADLNKSITETEAFIKSHVSGYTRTTASGASVQVAEHEDRRTPASRQADDASSKANKGSNDGSKHFNLHHLAARAHSHAMNEAGLRGDHQSAREHLSAAKKHISASTSKIEGKGSKASAATDEAHAFHHVTDADRHKKHMGPVKENIDQTNTYNHELSAHAHEEAAKAHKEHANSLSATNPSKGMAEAKAQHHQNQADINDAQ